MKEVKVAIIAVIITCAILISCACAMPVHAEERPEFYPKLTIIFNSVKDGDMWTVYCMDKSRNIWTFYDDVGDWEKGDIANLLMMTIDEIEENDQIIEVFWEGYTENLETFFQLEGWH